MGYCGLRAALIGLAGIASGAALATVAGAGFNVAPVDYVDVLSVRFADNAAGNALALDLLNEGRGNGDCLILERVNSPVNPLWLHSCAAGRHGGAK